VVDPRTRILIFAKAPRPGEVKTRLVPPLTPQAAADLHRELLEATVARLAAAHIAPIELWCAPYTQCEPFPSLADRHPIGLHGQTQGDLGIRMAHATADALDRGAAVVLVGTDCPPLNAAYVREAVCALQERDAVLGPAEDGGYVLLGLRRTVPQLFTRIPWGTDAVARLTRERLAALAWKWTELPTLWDVDRPADLVRYRRLLSGAG